jgi:hypothetical protein
MRISFDPARNLDQLTRQAVFVYIKMESGFIISESDLFIAAIPEEVYFGQFKYESTLETSQTVF